MIIDFCFRIPEPQVDDSDPEILSDTEDVEAKKTLILAPYEAFFLAFGLGCLLVSDDKDEELSLEALWHLFVSINSSKFSILLLISLIKLTIHEIH